jgi:hypothetical protein
MFTMYISIYNTYEVGALIFYAFLDTSTSTPQDVIANPVLYQPTFVQATGNKILFRFWIKIRWWTRMRMNCVPASTAYSIATSVSVRDVYPGSRILIFTNPGSRIPDPKTATKEGVEKNLLS